MTAAQIIKTQELESARVALKFGTAHSIRQLLDEARRRYGAEAWDDGDLETAVLELVTEAP